MADIHIHIHGDGSVGSPSVSPVRSTSSKGKATVAKASKPTRKRSDWDRYKANKKNQIKFKTGKKKGLLDLKRMGVAYRKTKKGKKR